MIQKLNSKYKKIVVYPSVDEMTAIKNPYINDFCLNLENQGINILNKNPKGNHLFSISPHVFTADVFIFHWLESVPTYKSGFFQYVYSLALITLLKLFGKEIIWFCHNKRNHSFNTKTEEFLSNHLLKLIKKKASFIFTHSKEGLEILDVYKEKTIYLMHPTKNRLVEKVFTNKFDLLIWGTISEYKGILEFLLEVKSNLHLQSLKIKIIGKCENNLLFNEISKSLTKNVNFENRSVSFDELKTLRSSIKFVLIPYKSETILSSAILMDSLSFGFSVIGPNTGSFRELKEETRVTVKTYSNFNEIPNLILNSNEISNYENFLEEYNWSNFTRKMLNEISKTN